MKGSIYTSQKCETCGSTLKYQEGRGFLNCLKHPKFKWTGACRVRFGGNHTKRFKTVDAGAMHLNYLRYQVDHGTFDPREWRKDAPLSFRSQREKFLKHKKTQDITQKQMIHIEMVLSKAGNDWDRMQIKEITESEIDDFFVKTKKSGVGNKTLANYKTVLHDFWAWVVRREKRKSKIEMPEFPNIKFKMGWRNIISMKNQKKVLDEIWKITKDINPRIWLGIRLLTIFPRVRPGEMRNLKEGHINLIDGWLFFPDPKEGDKGKFIHLAPEDCQLIESLWNPKGLPNMFFFRHLKTRSGIREGVQFGPKYFKKWWDTACKNVGIENVDLYGGTKHSTVTALGQVMTPEQIQRSVTGHASNAFKRYMIPDASEARQARQAVAKIQGE